MLEVRGLACGYRGRRVLDDVTFTVGDGRAAVILGPNGVGKTTLFKTLLGLLAPLGGEVLLDGHRIDLRAGSSDMRRIAYVPQSHVPSFSFTVTEVVVMGRTPRLGRFATPSATDVAKAREVLGQLGLDDLADRDYTQLSGGERQMVLIARALVQEPAVLMMDEPAASLDLGNQARLLRAARKLADERGLSVVMSSHNPDHAFLVADDVLLVSRDGTKFGPANDLLDAAELSRVYDTRVRVLEGSGGAGRSCQIVL
jgi:iron complex transport system ATP-binding protein